MQARERRHLDRVRCRTGADAIQGSLRRAVDTAEAAADPRLLDELHRGQPQILQQPQIRIQRVERGERGRRVIAVVAHQLADVGPVFLLDMRVVVLLVRPAARELNGTGPTVAIQVVVDELGPVVRIDPAQREG